MNLGPKNIDPSDPGRIWICLNFKGPDLDMRKIPRSGPGDLEDPFYLFFIFYIKYILKLGFGERVLGIWEEHEYMMNILIFIYLLFRLFFLLIVLVCFFFPFLFAI